MKSRLFQALVEILRVWTTGELRLCAIGSGSEGHMRKQERALGEKTNKQPADRAKAKFARDITRAEFGRFYWDDRRAGEVRKACADRKKKPPP